MSGLDLVKQQAQIAKAVEWLRAHADADAQLHADSRSLKPGDVFFAYAVDGADSRPLSMPRSKTAPLPCCISRRISPASRTRRVRWRSRR